MATLNDKIQQVIQASTAVEVKIQQLQAQNASLQGQVNQGGNASGELTAEQEVAFDQLIEHLKSLAV